MLWWSIACRPEPSTPSDVPTPEVDSGTSVAPPTTPTGTTGDTATVPTSPPAPMSGIDPAAPGLIIYYDFESGTDVAQNLAVAMLGSYDGALEGTAIEQGPDGRYGRGLHLDRKPPEEAGELVFDYPDEVILPNSEWTVAFWVRPTTTTPTVYEDGVVSLHGEPDNAYCQIDYDVIAGGDDVLQVTVSAPLPVDAWSYVACAVGPASASLSVFTPTATHFSPAVYLGITAPFPSGHLGRRFFGSVDDFTVWSVGRSIQESCADAGGTWLDAEVRCGFPEPI